MLNGFEEKIDALQNDKLEGAIDTVQKLRFANGELNPENDAVVIEFRANLIINGAFYMSIMCLPKYFAEMAVGFMFSEGLIKSFSDIKKISNTCTGNIFVFTHMPVDTSRSEKRVLISGCASGSVNISFLNEENLDTLDKSVRINSSYIVKLMNKFSRQSPVFKETGAVHSASLVFEDGREIFYEDIGRHNAVDKIIGQALIENLDIKKGVLLISGRISSEIAIKAAKLGIAVLVSQAAPTSMSIAIAQKVDMTLVGFARGHRFNLYSGDYRVLPQ